MPSLMLLKHVCRSPHGERGLKLEDLISLFQECRRSPHGERGLKFDAQDNASDKIKSLSSRRAWIEIYYGS